MRLATKGPKIKTRIDNRKNDIRILKVSHECTNVQNTSLD